ncbi:DinB family protein [Bacillus toyonensis]|uniref:DinB family protein n=1 Tax=Bacillus toyonensis TaxID=155322 RepID=UPI000CD9241E|nr:DinB family protein [Bacillus toyonensis]MED3540584.1 DinB family protein [Bacillus toyonensis]MEE2021509.1 DinB family protein [Bacillus toyonensis]
MEQSNKAFSEALVKSLKGERGHLPIKNALSDIDAVLAGKHREELPYSIYQLVKHMTYWQDFLLLAARDEKPVLSNQVGESWPEEECPSSEEEWKQAIQYFLQGIEQACTIAQTVQLDKPLESWPGETPGGVLRNIASHNSYHLGEIVLIRRLFSAWPPPTGGYPV